MKRYVFGILVGLFLIVTCFLATAYVGSHDIRVRECAYGCDRRYVPDSQDWTDCCTKCADR
jgi:hypothetical protein